MNGEPEVSGRHEQRRLQGIYWACVVIWVGLVFAADSVGWLPKVGNADPWNWAFFGAGVLALLGALWREVSPKYARPRVGNYIWAGVLIIIGLSGVITFKITRPLILLLVGLALLALNLFRRR